MMDRLSNMLAYAQDCDVHVLEDLRAWLNSLSAGCRRSSQLEFAAAAAAAASIVEKFLAAKKKSQLSFAAGSSHRSLPATGKRQIKSAFMDELNNIVNSSFFRTSLRPGKDFLCMFLQPGFLRHDIGGALAAGRGTEQISSHCRRKHL